jgi:hypothetical protein
MNFNKMTFSKLTTTLIAIAIAISSKNNLYFFLNDFLSGPTFPIKGKDKNSSFLTANHIIIIK